MRNKGCYHETLRIIITLYAIVINVLHFCFEPCALKMTSKMKHMSALFLMNGIYLICLIQNTFVIYFTTLQAICTNCPECTSVCAALNELFCGCVLHATTCRNTAAKLNINSIIYIAKHCVRTIQWTFLGGRGRGCALAMDLQRYITATIMLWGGGGGFGQLYVYM